MLYSFAVQSPNPLAKKPLGMARRFRLHACSWCPMPRLPEDSMQGGVRLHALRAEGLRAQG